MRNYAGMPPPQILQILEESAENLRILGPTVVEHEWSSKMVPKSEHLPSKFLSWFGKMWRSEAADSR